VTVYNYQDQDQDINPQDQNQDQDIDPQDQDQDIDPQDKDQDQLDQGRGICYTKTKKIH